jgi:uncharacterized cupredoxin-like copper-binding protein
MLPRRAASQPLRGGRVFPLSRRELCFVPACIAVTMIVGFVSGCSSGLNKPVQEVTATTGTDGVQHVEITAHSFWFEPNRIVVKSGVPVELKVHNASWIVPHGFSCLAPEAGLQAKEGMGFIGKTKKIKFTPKEPGEYSFFCHVDGHAKKGMKGTIVVQ